MKSVRMKGKSVEDAVSAALGVLGLARDQVDVKVLSEGRLGMMGLIGGEEAEVEVFAKEEPKERAQGILQDILDRMGLLAIAEVISADDQAINLVIKGEDMGRIIGKEGIMLKALETIVGAILRRTVEAPIRVRIDAGGYMEKREKVLQRLAAEVAEEVGKTGVEKVLPYMEASDRRIMHLFLKDYPNVTSFSRGEGKDRRMVIAPK